MGQEEIIAQLQAENEQLREQYAPALAEHAQALVENVQVRTEGKRRGGDGTKAARNRENKKAIKVPYGNWPKPQMRWSCYIPRDVLIARPVSQRLRHRAESDGTSGSATDSDLCHRVPDRERVLSAMPACHIGKVSAAHLSQHSGRGQSFRRDVFAPGSA
jgi:hypothetical protein